MWFRLRLIASLAEGGRSPTEAREAGKLFGICLRREQAQRAMWSFIVMQMPVIGEDNAGFAERIDELTVQALPAELIVEAFHVAVLPGTARIDVDGLNALFSKPLLDGCRDKLRSVVRADILGCPVFLNRFFEHGQYIACLDRTVGVDAVALLSELVEHVEHPELASKHCMIAHEVPCPDMVTMVRLLGKPCRETLAAFARLWRWHL